MLGGGNIRAGFSNTGEDVLLTSWGWLLFNLGVGKRSRVHCTVLRTLQLIILITMSRGRAGRGRAGRGTLPAGGGEVVLLLCFSD